MFLLWTLLEFIALMQHRILYLDFSPQKYVFGLASKYSPEFNPVELYWRYLKRELWNLSSPNNFICIKD
jgi:transposase